MLTTQVPAVVTTAAEKIAPSALSFFVGRLYERIGGNSYSKTSRKHLAILIESYSRHLKRTECPPLWKLDANNRPTLYFQGDDFSKLYTSNTTDASMRNYPSETKTISQNIIAYLNERKQRWVGGSRPGDLLEQFLCEWLDWSTNSLPTIGYDAKDITILKQRLAYIDDIILNDFLFNYGWFNRKHNKYECFEVIKHSLTECLSLAKQEKMRVCVTQKLDVMRSNMVNLLLQSLDVIYYCRKTDMSKVPLRIDYTTIDSSPLKTFANSQILKEIIYKAGTGAFTLKETKPTTPLIYQYFDKNNNPLPITWNDKTKKVVRDLPVWVPDLNEPEVLNQLQNIGSAIIHYAEIKKIIEKTQNVAAQSGNTWAYADATGKRLIKAIIYLHNSTLLNLQNLIEEFIREQNTLRGTFAKIQRNKQQNSSSANQQMLQQAVLQINNYASNLFETMKEIEQQLLEYDINTPLEINQLKQDLYSQVNDNLEVNHPSKVHEFKLDTTIPESEPTTSFDFPLKINANHKLIYVTPSLQHFAFNEPKTPNILIWKIGESYHDWVINFFINNKKFLDNYATLVKNFQLACQTNNTADINEKHNQLTDALKLFLKKINDERPRWRLFPPTAGWPFNRTAREFASLFTAELTVVKSKLALAVEQALEKAKQQPSTTALIAGLTNSKPGKLLIIAEKTETTEIGRNATFNPPQQLTKQDYRIRI
jgi:hypothetical protein